MISLRLRLFAFELFKAAKSTSSSGTLDFQQWNSRLPAVELSTSSSGTREFHPRIFLELHSPFPLRHRKVVIKSIRIRVYKQINLLQNTQIQKNLLQSNYHTSNRLSSFAVDSVDFFMFFLRARVSFKNTTHYTNVTNRQYLDCEAILILVLEVMPSGANLEIIQGNIQKSTLILSYQ